MENSERVVRMQRLEHLDDLARGITKTGQSASGDATSDRGDDALKTEETPERLEDLASSPTHHSEPIAPDDKDVEDDMEVKYGTGDPWLTKEYEPLELNYDALRHIATYYLPGHHGRCTTIHTLQRGSYHEIRVLEFEDGWTCIGRFTRDRSEQLCVTESEFATVAYVRKHTSIPVPETYFVNFDPTNAVGAPFVLMERMTGVHLYRIWDKLSVDLKKDVIEQIADVKYQLACVKFDNIGSVALGGDIGSLQSKMIPDGVKRGPFDTMEEWLFSFIPEDEPCAVELETSRLQIREAVHKDLTDQKDDPIYNPPFRLIHGDFDAQNMLFDWPDRSKPPKLSAIIDWDYTYTGPLYYLYEYPCFIMDLEDKFHKHLFAENKVLRKAFVSRLLHSFPKGSIDRADVREAFKQKTYMYNAYPYRYIRFVSAEDELRCTKRYVKGVSAWTEGKNPGGMYFPYGGRVEWEPDSEPESEEEDGCDGR